MLSFGTIDGFRISSVNRNLLPDFEECDTNVVPGNELMKVYLRLRPFKPLPNEANLKPVLKCDNKYVVTASPPDCKKFSVRESRRAKHTFTFSHVFESSTTQSSLFSVVAIDQIRGFLEGLNGLIFAYGTTGSGKTYTMQGSLDDVGMVPRALCMLFRTVKNTINPLLIPKDFSDVATLTPVEVEKLLKDKMALLKLSSNLPEDVLNVDAGDCQMMSTTRTFPNSTPYVGMESGDSRGQPNYISDLRFNFWISFAEIYNELVYDLLDPAQCATASQVANSSRANAGVAVQKNIFSTTAAQSSNVFELSTHRLRKRPLELRTDKNGNVFIKGLHTFPINSPEEALRLILVGRQCQQVAATRLNQSSSRSHSILTIKAVRVVDKENPKFARISSLTFCDLAGSERSEKAATGGQANRLREAGNINTSLLTLGRCIECLRYNQVHPDNPKLVPYRDSKLTRLFQGFFTGRGKACMVVNASAHPELFDETLHALRFSALATRIIIQPNAIVDTTIAQESSTTNETIKRKAYVPRQAASVVRKVNTEPITATPPTVVPNRNRVTLETREESSWSNSVLKEPTLSLEDQSTDMTGTVLEGSVSSRNFSPSPRTPTNTDGSELILEDYSKEELIYMVKELSEQLFESKGELVEQEARLRHEMCDAMNRQLVEFERLYEESWNAQEKLLVEQSNRRLEHYAQQADERGVRASHARKRRRQDDTESSSDDETSIDDSIQFNDELSECNLQVAEMGIGKSDLNGSGVAVMGKSHAGKPQDEAQLAESRERVKELEEELADQRDLIENLSRDRDHLRVEINRLEFASAQLQRQLEAERAASAKKVSQDSASQTDLLMRDVNGDLGQGFADQSISKSTIQHSLFEDSEIVVRLPKSKDPTNALKSGRKFFDSSVSPEQAQRLLPTSSSWCDSDKAPNTVIRMPVKPAVDRRGFGEHIEVIEKADGLREENQMLFARLAQTKTCAQKTIQQQQKHDAELEFTRLHAASVLDESKYVRMSEGLQSFLENESRLQQMETMEQLQQQIYELEEQFASKHDALLRLEMAYERLLNEKEELTQRLLSQVDKIARLGHEITDLQTNHQDELHTLQVKEKQARELALAKVREEFESRLLKEQLRLASLQNRAPDQDVSVQVGAIETLLDTSVQTIAQEQIKSSDVSLQVSLCTLSVGSQTEPPTPKTPGLGSPILPVRSSADVDGHFKKPACRKTNTSNIDTDATLDQTTTASRALRSGTQRSLRLRYQDTRQTKPHNKGLYSFKLPSPVSLQPFTSDSESDTETVSTEEDKENRGRTTHHSKETTDEEDAKSCSSEPVRQIKKQTGPARRARSGSRPILTDKPEQSLSTRARLTRSVAATRRLPPLAESTQLMPDSFFQDELDAALDHVDAEENRRQLRPQVRQKLRRRR
ncbi:hypothetical protein P879_05754 [Paragonimus westermani]|uniref:Kinesin motor domain-containing protein n=1 Tax=Paragonimus westermani TaxID=34504 RepID=A0A8T0DNS2_9TREM|nr:hypothetical protein P879_05754 [Paragonimus westermani]